VVLAVKFFLQMVQVIYIGQPVAVATVAYQVETINLYNLIAVVILAETIRLYMILVLVN
jgi:hypothetical protein